MLKQQEELEQWVEAAKQKEEDNLALQKYTRADEAKTKELALNLEKVTGAIVERKTEVDNEVSGCICGWGCYTGGEGRTLC